MITALIAPVTSLLVSAGAGAAVESAIKIVLPSTTKAIAGFGVRVGTAIVAGSIATALSKYTLKQTQSIVETVNGEPKVLTIKEDN